MCQNFLVQNSYVRRLRRAEIERRLAICEAYPQDPTLRYVEAGDTRGALRELEHFVAALEDSVLVPLEAVILKGSGACDGFPWLVKSRPERFGLSI